MRQAYNFTGMNYINVTGIPETFWQERDWSITALVKFGDILKPNSAAGQYDIAVLGIGTNNGTGDELHLGFRGTSGSDGKHFVSTSGLVTDCGLIKYIAGSHQSLTAWWVATAKMCLYKNYTRRFQETHTHFYFLFIV